MRLQATCTSYAGIYCRRNTITRVKCVFTTSAVFIRGAARIQATCAPYMQLRILQENNLLQEEYLFTSETCVYNSSSIHRIVYRPLGSNMHLKRNLQRVYILCVLLCGYAVGQLACHAAV